MTESAEEQPGRLRASRFRTLWLRISDWLGIDRSPPVDLLTTDPARHFKEWDRDLPEREWG